MAERASAFDFPWNSASAGICSTRNTITSPANAAHAFAQTAGLILQTTGSYWPLFIMAGSAYLLALAIMQALIPDMKPAKLIGRAH